MITIFFQITIGCLLIMNKAVFIDRDGVINEDRGHVHKIDDFVLIPGVIEGLARLQEAKYKLIVITNQAGIAHGYYDQNAMERLHDYLIEILALHNVVLDGIYFCPHHPNGIVSSLAVGCNCRKPAPGMVIKAANEHMINLSSSVLIGDKLTDIEAGKRAGVGLNILVKSDIKVDETLGIERTIVSDTLLDAVKYHIL